MKQILQPPPLRSRKTKIICAIGPSCWSVEMLGTSYCNVHIHYHAVQSSHCLPLSTLGELLDAGMNVARLNFSHGDHEMHARSLANLRKAVEARPGCHCAVLLDTKGPEIRTGVLRDHKSIQLEVRHRVAVTVYASLVQRGTVTLTLACVHQAGQELEITTDYAVEGDATRIACSYKHLPTSVSPGSKILCDDGSLVMTVLACTADAIRVRVLNSHVLEEKKNMNLPGAAIQVPGITAKDETDLQHFAIPQAVDIVSGSFVRCAANVRAIRACLGDRGRHIRVHAKIESIEALRNIDEIIREADGVHVSRGDLGMELSPEQVFLAQKMIIRKANIAGKPVVTSTQVRMAMALSSAPEDLMLCVH